ncbi:MAG: hypothetical protein ACRDFB_04560, partial [Rhabdochlamydiaceae bacterium]
MKKIGLLTVCCSMIFAENPMSIEIVDDSEDEIVIPASAAPEKIAIEDSFKIIAPPLPDSQAPGALILPTKDVKLSTESPLKTAPLATEQTLPIPAPSIVQQLQLDPEEDDIAVLEREEKEVAEEIKSNDVVIDLGQVFAGSPTIYSVLFILSIASVGICAYALLSLRNNELFPTKEFEELKNQLYVHSYETALDTCTNNPTLFFGMVAT